MACFLFAYLNKYKQELADKEKAYKDQSQMGNSASAGQPMPMQMPGVI